MAKTTDITERVADAKGCIKFMDMIGWECTVPTNEVEQFFMVEDSEIGQYYALENVDGLWYEFKSYEIVEG